jgi:glycosyltransferase involved in cell wall biosynthesis
MLKNHPKFSIITPTYNRAYVLWKAIISIQKQSISDWELLIIDDGSTDDTLKLLAEFQEDTRIKTFAQKNQGPAEARNLGLENATGDIIIYLDSDDEFYPDCLRIIDQCLSAQPGKNYGVCNHNRTQEFIDESFKTKALKVDSTPQNQTVTMQHYYDWEVKTTSTGLFHRRAIFEGKIKWTPGIYIEDLEILMQLSVLDESGFLHIPQTLFSYRQKYGGDGLCSNASYETWAQSFGTIYALHRHDPLMKNPDVYLGRVAKYMDLHQKDIRGEVTPQVYKFFPELWEQKLAS